MHISRAAPGVSAQLGFVALILHALTCFFFVAVQMAAAVASAKEAFVSWRDVPVQQRMRVMLKYQVRQNGGAVRLYSASLRRVCV